MHEKRSRPFLQLAALLALSGFCALAQGEDPKFVFVKVSSDGKSCEVQKHEGSCDAVIDRVAHAHKELPGSGVIVSPKECGEAAMNKASAIAEQLRKAGFRGVYAIGLITAPDSKCLS
jgi:hypothetical protein